ncbi:MAG: hypothetical protein DA407_00205 [Bacteroidetes bacterium]|nr:MAG: hypothetical protein DA407_00205 [Bacteroidota bacterium]
MDLFSFISIALSFVYTAAALRLIGGLSAATNKQSRYIVHLIFIAVQIVSIVMSFWGTWALRDEVDWKLYKLILALMDGALYYFLATVLVPENPNEIKSWKNYYYENKNKFFCGVLVFLFYVQIHSIVLTNQEFLHPARLANLVALIPIYLGLRSKSHKVHLGIAIYYLIFVIIMVFTVASEPGWVDSF